MTPTSPDPQVIIAFISVLVAGAFALWAIPHDCRCPHCVVHTNERRAHQERNRRKRHRDMHAYWNIPWDEEACSVCRGGHLSDRSGN